MLYVHELERIGATFIPMPENGFSPARDGFYTKGIIRIAGDKYEVNVYIKDSIDSRIVSARAVDGKCTSGLSLKQHLRNAIRYNMNGISDVVSCRRINQFLYYLVLGVFSFGMIAFTLMTLLHITFIRILVICITVLFLKGWKSMRHRIIFGRIKEVGDFEDEEE